MAIIANTAPTMAIAGMPPPDGGVGSGDGAPLTVTVQLASFPSAEAFIVTVPAFTAVTVPSDDTVAVLSSELVQVTAGNVASEGDTAEMSFTVLPISNATEVLSSVTLVTCMTLQCA